MKESFMLDGRTIGFIGAGNMGGVLIRGLIQSGRVNMAELIVSDVNRARLREIKRAYGVKTCESNIELVKKADIVIIGVKPHHVDALLDEISAASRAGQIFISIIAGAPVKKFSSRLNPVSGCIRVMPNTPAFVLAGAAAIYAGSNVSPEDLERAAAIFECTGKTVIIQNETLMDAVTGLSGSGPAYVFLAIEALADAGVQLGIARKEASLLAAQTVYGAAKMLLETGKSPGELKDMVTTPGGTTAAGLRMLEKGNFRSAIMDAVEAAARRARELGKPPDGGSGK
jgi:pyrroline-5-carboxylate reductase